MSTLLSFTTIIFHISFYFIYHFFFLCQSFPSFSFLCFPLAPLHCFFFPPFLPLTIFSSIFLSVYPHFSLFSILSLFHCALVFLLSFHSLNFPADSCQSFIVYLFFLFPSPFFSYSFSSLCISLLYLLFYTVLSLLSLM